jgi:chorismate mutase/prephenate dehydratase
MNKEIKNLRTKIDEIDEKLINLLENRILFAKKIGEIKKLNNIPVLDANREKLILKKIKNLKKIFPLEMLNNIFSNIMAGSRLIEQKLKIIYLGPKGSFTYKAAKTRFPEANHLMANSISAIFNEVENNKGDYGIVPIENSSNGVVTYTLDQFLTTSLHIVDEILIKISHCLVSNEKNINKIKNIYSHPQSFGQCENWISNTFNSKINLIPVESNSLATKISKNEKNSAAIYSSEAAELYNLNILKSDIQDFKNNTTRFLIIGKELNKSKKLSKTSIAFAIKDEVGLLYKCLEPFHRHKINLCKIESRPNKTKNWNYIFFVDFDGNISSKKINAVLEEIKKYCNFIKILGSYPKAKNL